MGGSGSDAGFQVDVAGVRAFGASLRGDLDNELWPAGESITATFQAGVCFGQRTASPSVQAAAVEYHRRLDEMVALMDTFLHNSEVMAQAATDVVRAYDQADSMSGTDLQRVIGEASQKVDAAAGAAQVARQEAEQRAARAEDAFLHHLGGGG